METKMYVGNLSYNVGEDDLRQLFGQAGEVKDVALALYSREVAMRVLGRIQDASGFSSITPDRALSMAKQYDLNYLVIDRDMNLNDFKLFAGRRPKGHLIWSFRTSHKEIARPNLSHDPALADITLAELCRTFELARNQRLRCGGNQVAIDDTRELITPHIQSGPV